MIKLAALRAAILAAPIGVTDDKLLAFAKRGKVESHRGGVGDHQAFALHYTAHLMVIGYERSPADLFFAAAQWLHRDNPAAAADALSFEVDVIDGGTVDVTLSLDLSEIVAVIDNPDGVVTRPMPDTAADSAAQIRKILGYQD